jgi:SAM-dependent MidA family methyltransferase
MTKLLNILLSQIRQTGPITIADYMKTCLLHPNYGYYSKQDPFGANGDFITSPEISQMFGELLGLCLAQNWIDQGMKPFALVEAGPGRGTLMIDILHATKLIPEFHQNMTIHLIEESIELQKIQKEKLSGFRAQWHTSIHTIPNKAPYFIANEFFDALPIRQFKRAAKCWEEILIGEKNGKLVFYLGNKIPLYSIPHHIENTKIGDVVETCIAAKPIIAVLSDRIKNYGGCAIIVDYGDDDLVGNTFQAVKNHKKINTLKLPGDSDLTAHVDFKELTRDISEILVTKTTPQGILLDRLGINDRTKKLTSHIPDYQKTIHDAALRRLTHPSEMGSLFKAIALYPSASFAPAGFDL